MIRLLKILLTVCLLGFVFPAKADIVYPARLEWVEISPGLFEVRLTLPVIQGKVLKARPALPDICSPLAEPQWSGDANTAIAKWEAQCTPENLPGQTIGIDGLLGSTVDIYLQITTLSGRTYSTTLTPAHAYYQIPLPPTIWQLFSQGVLDGLRFLLKRPELYLFVWLLLLVSPSSRKGIFGTVALPPCSCWDKS